MEIMNAFTAHTKTLDAIQAKHDYLLKKIDARITATISKGEFKCNFVIDSPILQDELFDYLTKRSYAVHFSPAGKQNILECPDSRVMTVSWEDAIQ